MSPELAAVVLGLTALIVYLKITAPATPAQNPRLAELRKSTFIDLQALGSFHPLSKEKALKLFSVITKLQKDCSRLTIEDQLEERKPYLSRKNWSAYEKFLDLADDESTRLRQELEKECLVKVNVSLDDYISKCRKAVSDSDLKSIRFEASPLP